MRNFETWLSTFRSSIADYGYYVDFEKVYRNVEDIKIELSILNTLIGSKKIEDDFRKIIHEYPQTLKCIPILLAVRQNEISIMDGNTSYNFNFTHPNYSIDDYVNFMRKSGLFELLSNHIVSNLNDYVLGIETGLDSNGRKNRGGHLMEKLVESYIKKLTIKYTYYKEMYLSEIQNKWGINLANLSNDGKAEKRFDFVIKTDSMVYAIETNFYGSGGSKLNETARSYKMLSLEAKQIEGFKFIWITDGTSWFTAKKNLQETFDIMDDMYNITDLENGILNQIIV